MNSADRFWDDKEGNKELRSIVYMETEANKRNYKRIWDK